MATLSLMNATTVDYAIPEHWAEMLYHDHALKSFWGKFEGAEGSGMPIIRKDEMNKLKRNGDVIHFTTKTRLKNAGVTGNSTLAGSEGKVVFGQFNLTVDWLRNAMAYDEQADQEAFFDTSMVINDELSDWFARREDWDLFNQLINTDSPTVLYANSKTNDNQLSTTEKFGTTELDMLHLALRRKGARPIRTIKKGKAIIPIYACVITELDAYHLRADTAWQNAQANAQIRGSDNPLFTSAEGMYGGMIVYVHSGIAGIQGTPLCPETKVVGAHTDSVLTLTVGTNDGDLDTEYFPSSGVLAIIASDGTTEYCDYSAKSAYTFTLTSRGYTYGALTSSAAAYTGDERVVFGNYRTVQLAFGMEIACRGYVKPLTPIRQMEDYEFERGLGFKTIYGQKAIVDTTGVPPNYIVGHAAANIPNATI